MCYRRKYVQNHLYNWFQNRRYRWGSLHFHPLWFLYFTWQKKSKLKLQACLGFSDESHNFHVSHGCHISYIVLSANSMKWFNWMKPSERGEFVDFLYVPKFILTQPKLSASTTRELFYSFGVILILIISNK